ncbi:FkbM family methyltransferase [Rhizobium skierniewicense]|uniref:FkbM family methyltransferase n=1 Tax=Rhizobium skierniewicense TaxID=984260 RepID=UPI001573EAAA|nr:FkbM family methyltransferase [Rhizobium skierniewicense]
MRVIDVADLRDNWASRHDTHVLGVLVKKILRSAKRRFLELVNAKSITVEGLEIVIEKGVIPENVRQELLRDKYEDTERNLLLTFLKPGMRVLEIGTGIGFISLLAARIVGEENVFCYEANASLEAIIRKNHALNALTPSLTMRAVTTDGQDVVFYQSDNVISSSVYDRQRNDRKTVVKSVAFHAVLDEIDPDVLVMDVEGAEIDLLAQPSLKNIRHIIVELHPHIVGQEQIDALLLHLKQDCDYSVVARDRKTVYLQSIVARDA